MSHLHMVTGEIVFAEWEHRNSMECTHTHNTLHSVVITSDDREPGILLTPSGWRITAKVVMGLNEGKYSIYTKPSSGF